MGFSDVEEDELWRRWRAGDSSRQIARALGCAPSSVQRHLARTGGVRPPARRRADAHLLANHLRAAGAAGFVSKSALARELVDAIRSAGLTPAPLNRPEPAVSVLSLREREVMRLIAQGLGNDDIARSLSIAVGTVKRHNTNIFAKLGATSRTEAVAKAARIGEIDAPLA